jgi:opacity protein-like surface antigen
MKLKTLLLTTALVAAQVATTAPASAEKKHANHSDDYYAKLEAGVAMPDRNLRTDWGRIRTRNGFVGGLGAGYQISEFFRTDLMLQLRELRTRRTDFPTALAEGTGYSGSARINAFTAMLNGYVDGHNDTIFTPYLMAGVGVSRTEARATVHRTAANNVSSASGRARRTTLAWNVGAGAQAKVSDQVSIDLSYRYVSLGRLGRTRNLGGVAGAFPVRFNRDLRTQEIVAGLIWQF